MSRGRGHDAATPVRDASRRKAVLHFETVVGIVVQTTGQTVALHHHVVGVVVGQAVVGKVVYTDNHGGGLRGLGARLCVRSCSLSRVSSLSRGLVDGTRHGRARGFLVRFLNRQSRRRFRFRRFRVARGFRTASTPGDGHRDAEIVADFVNEKCQSCMSKQEAGIWDTRNTYLSLSTLPRPFPAGGLPIENGVRAATAAVKHAALRNAALGEFGSVCFWAFFCALFCASLCVVRVTPLCVNPLCSSNASSESENSTSHEGTVTLWSPLSGLIRGLVVLVFSFVPPPRPASKPASRSCDSDTSESEKVLGLFFCPTHGDVSFPVCFALFSFSLPAPNPSGAETELCFDRASPSTAQFDFHPCLRFTVAERRGTSLSVGGEIGVRRVVVAGEVTALSLFRRLLWF